ncbi:MAG TPA: hypothetical protein VGP87_11140 [Gemmatimonadales bacterium]|nr:hypothetical protein [Gemmatimonadales bacterium]
MRKYWGKIILGALLIFGVGFGLVSAARGVKNRIISAKDISIPLGSFIGFNLDGTRLGSIRSLTIQRSSPKMIIGFEIRARLTDSAGLSRLEKCHVSVNDIKNIDERTHFICLPSDSGYVPFGELRAELRTNDGMRTVVLPLLLPPGAVADIQNHAASSGVPVSDSAAEEIRNRVRTESQAYRDSLKAADLDDRAARANETAARYKERADSIRGHRATPQAPTQVAPKPAKPPLH